MRSFIHRLLYPSLRGGITTVFVIIAVLVLVLASGNYYQLRQVKPYSTNIIQASSDMESLQRMRTATEALDADLERYLTIRGVEYLDTIRADILEMGDAYAVLSSSEFAREQLEFESLTASFNSVKEEIQFVLDALAVNSSTGEINRRIVALYKNLDVVRESQDLLRANILDRLQTAAKNQGQIANRVSLQSIILGVIVAATGVLATLVVNFRLRGITELTQVTTAIASGDLTRAVPERRRDEIGVLARSFNVMTSRLREMMNTLEQRVNARTQELSLAADVGRNVSKIRDLDTLLPSSVELIRSQFNLYYVQIYLTDASGSTLILRAGTGGVGAELMRRGHRLSIGPGSINGMATADRKPVIVSDTLTSSIFRANSLLPETRSELAMPLLVGDRVVGVLDLQSRHPGGLSEENLSVFETLAGQLAIALDNAALFAQSEEARKEVEEQTRRMTQVGWQGFLNAVERSERIGYMYDQDNLQPYNAPLPEFQSENMVKSSIVVTGSSIGTIQLERAGDQPWQDEEVELVNAVVGQAARQLDNLRLLAQAESYRNDAEESARRLTREGWGEYLETRPEIKGFVYNQNEVKSLETSVSDDQLEQLTSTIVHPLKVGEEPMGELAFDGVASLDEATHDLVTNVAEVLSGHIEGLRLTEQTQRALIDTEDLYTAGSELNVARTYQDILEVMRRHSLVGDNAHVVMVNLFNRPGSENDVPEFVKPAAVWNDVSLEKVPERYPMADYPAALATLHPNYPTLVEDVLNDTRLDEAARVLYSQQLKARSLLIIPLVAGGLWVGFMTAGYPQVREFLPEAVRRAAALAAQAAVAINNLRLLAETQALAQRETNLRQITALVRGSTNADAILRTATRELGSVLGRRVKVQLGGHPASEKPTRNGGTGDEKSSDNTIIAGGDTAN